MILGPQVMFRRALMIQGSAYSTTTPSAGVHVDYGGGIPGDKERWTFAAWFKPRLTIENRYLMGQKYWRTGYYPSTIIRIHSSTGYRIEWREEDKNLNLKGHLVTDFYPYANYDGPGWEGEWFHLCAIYNADAGTPEDRMEIHCNGIRQPHDHRILLPQYHWSGWNRVLGDKIFWDDNNYYGSRYTHMTEVHMIDGYNAAGTQFVDDGYAIKYNGPYGAQGYYLKFEEDVTYGPVRDWSGNNDQGIYRIGLLPDLDGPFPPYK